MTMAPTDEKPSHSEKIEGHGFHRLLHRFRKPKSPQNAMVAKTASNVESKESPALLPTVDPESNSKERESLRNISFDLWSDAYDRLRDDHETKDVVQKYEQILTREFNGEPL